jgi:hypothetical protein
MPSNESNTKGTCRLEKKQCVQHTQTLAGPVSVNGLKKNDFFSHENIFQYKNEVKYNHGLHLKLKQPAVNSNDHFKPLLLLLIILG